MVRFDQNNYRYLFQVSQVPQNFCMLLLVLFHVHAVLNRCLLLILAVAVLLLLFLRCLLMSPVYIQYPPPSCYTMLYNKEAVSLPLCSISVSASSVATTGLIQRFIILLTDFSSSQSCLFLVFLGKVFVNFMVISETFSF